MLPKLKLISLIVGLTVILYSAWAKPLDASAIQRVDEGFKRAAISFGTARLIGAAISVVQDIDFSAQPFGVGVKFSPGQALHSIGDLVDKFANLMLVATVIFGAMKMLLIIGGSKILSMVLTCTSLGWIWCHWRGQSQLWLSKLVVVLMLVRFAVPIAMVGSDMVYKTFLDDTYKSNQSDITTPDNSKQLSDSLDGDGIGKWGQAKNYVWSNIETVKSVLLRACFKIMPASLA